ncbi:hypothetical protein PVK06_039440 [Gossypium arboreum]|uniref:Uncharacterized protein n=1 Tax=Gossypium arboreum TaxID=29729 RepID=A0ABR0N2W9_GOSAR|nr:hypothetical protein PVK06_039440 [Gossypium arboreum]
MGTTNISSLQALLSHIWRLVICNKRFDPNEEITYRVVGKPIAIRFGSGNKFEGKTILFCGVEEGSIDIEVCLFPETIGALAIDEEFMDVLTLAQLCYRTFSTFWVFSYKSNATTYPTIPAFSFPLIRSSSIHLHFTVKFRPVSCHSIRSGSFDPQFNEDDNKDLQFLEASLLVSEQIKWQSSRKEQHPMSRAKIASIGQSFLSCFSTPTIFLKISCDGDSLLINLLMLGEFAVEKLIASFWGDDNEECLDQFHLVKNVVEKLGYEIW